MAFQQNFQRTMSKVWWMNDSIPNTIPNTMIHSKSIHENHISIKSQDSGFSDSDISEGKMSSPLTEIRAQKSFSDNEVSPSTSTEILTPPTVIRNKIKRRIHKMTPRRIFLASPLSESFCESPDLSAKIDSLNFSSESPTKFDYHEISIENLNDGNNNESVIESQSNILNCEDILPRTSTPNNLKTINLDFCNNTIPENNNTDALPENVKNWMSEIRTKYSHEVLSTLQTKSIEVEAANSLHLTATMAAKLIKHVQKKVSSIQRELENADNLLISSDYTLQHIDYILQTLPSRIKEFGKIIRFNYIFNGDELETFDENIDNIVTISNELLKLDSCSLDKIRKNVDNLKCNILILVQQIFNKLISVVVDSILYGKCDLILKLNLNSISMLSNSDYSGFASLKIAFLKNDTIRVLLQICKESVHSSTRALALRALASVCSAVEFVKHFDEEGGIDVLSNILDHNNQNKIRTEPELREIVSVLIQLTSSWNGQAHKITRLKEYLEVLVEDITDLIENTTCSQTLLLCAACLNNFSKIEPTAIYSLMSNQAILKFKSAMLKQKSGISIFLCEQITSTIVNMVCNKKCHNHLANIEIIKFIISIFKENYYESFNYNAETEALNRTMENIFSIFLRLIHSSALSSNVIEEYILPIFNEADKSLNGESNYSLSLSFMTNQIIQQFPVKRRSSSKSKEEDSKCLLESYI